MGNGMGGIDRMYGKRKRLESEREGERKGEREMEHFILYLYQ